MKIRLSDLEMLTAGVVGLQRCILSHSKGLKDHRHTSLTQGWGIDVVGAMAEMAFAKALSLYYLPTIDTFKLPDVGAFQVRSTEYANGVLIIRPNDPYGRYVLVHSNPPDFNILGWFELGEDSFLGEQKPLGRYDNRPCWQIPKERLMDIAALMQEPLPDGKTKG